MGVSNIIALLCGVSLFLYGMQLMGDGLKSVAGNGLEKTLYKLTNNPLKGVLLGTGITAIIQSSSATSIMAVGFVNSGLMKVKQAIGVVLGAILGTSVTGYVICLSNINSDSNGILELLSTATLTGVISIIGIYFRMFCKKREKQHFGDILLGFAVLMTGITAMSDSVIPLRNSPAFINFLTTFKSPFLGILIGLAITCILQSASATVGILQALSVTGVINFEIAFPIIMGIAIGAAVPVLLSALGTNINAKRTAFVYLLIDVLGVIIVGGVFYILNAVFNFSFLNKTLNMFSIAVLNTLFRLITVIILSPLIGLLEKIVCFIFPESEEDKAENAEIDGLEEKFIDHPVIAIEQSQNAVKSMARKSLKNIMRAFDLLKNFSVANYKKIYAKEEIIDKYEDKLGNFVIKLTSEELSTDQSREVAKILHTIGDFERIGDHAVNLANTANEIASKKITFSTEAQKDLDVIEKAVIDIVEKTVNAFTNDDILTAKKVEPLEEVIDGLCEEMKLRHIERLQNKNCSLDNGFVFNDILNNLERIADHCSNVAVAILTLNQDRIEAHAYLHEVKSQSTRFKKYYEKYSEEYKI